MQFTQVMVSIFAGTGNLVALTIANPIPNWRAGGIAIPLARHSSFLENKSLDLDAISSHGISVREKILSGLDNYEMNTGTTHPFAVKQSQHELGTRSARVPLKVDQNGFWIGDISIGTPPKTLKVQIDTGAADMWILQTGCSGISRDRDLWNPHLSNSAKYQNQPFLLSYGDGSIVEGDQYTDNVTIAGFTADAQMFGSATSYTSPFQNNGYADGLLGLAFSSISRLGAYTLFESLSRQNRLINPTFSFKLSSSGSGAEMYLGGANSMLYNGDITYAPVTHPAFWLVSMNNLRVNGAAFFENLPTMFDTGAAYIFGDWEQVSELYKPLGGTLIEHGSFGYYYLPCDSFPSVSFTFGGRAFEIPPESLRLHPITQGSPKCFSAIIAQRSPEFWVIGFAFLQSVYSVFDYGNLQVGFADLA